ncbi:MAG: dihydrofolate reductase [bacterium]|nr:dihydrofolate reductase [bacterium]
MKISIVAAIDEKRGLGKNNDLLFRIPEDLKRFRQLTAGKPVIMGRKTFKSIGRPLPNRTNIVITRDKNYNVPNIMVVHSLEEAIKTARSHCHPELGSGSRFSREKMPKLIRQAQSLSDNRRQVRHDNNNEECEAFVIGGGEIFAQALPLVQKLYLTLVEGDYGADTFFPDYSEFKKVVNKQIRESGDYKYTFLDLER